jgi:hypothetical protein
MKRTSLAVALLFFVSSPVTLLAQEQVLTEMPAEEPTETLTETPQETAPSGIETVVSGKPGTSRPPCGMRRMQKEQCRHRKGQDGGKYDGGGYGKCRQDDRERLVQRLDMIEARMAKIEAMLEILVQR